MAGSGVALRLHEFRESQDCGKRDGPTPTSRPGRDVNGLHPGQLGRVHAVLSKDCGCRRHGGRPPSLQEDHRPSFDLRTLRALAGLHRRPSVPEQRPPQTAYQEQFGLRPPLAPRSPSMSRFLRPRVDEQ